MSVQQRFRMVAWWLVVSAVCPAAASTVIDVSMPQPGARTPRNNSGVNLKVYSEWCESSGYRPVYVTASIGPPTTADRTFDVTLSPNDYRNSRDQIEVQLTIPEGARTATVEVGILQKQPWQRMNVTVTEEGQLLSDISGAANIARSVNFWDWTEAFPSILYIDLDAPQSGRMSSNLRRSYSLPELWALREIIAPMGDLERFDFDPDESYNDREVVTLARAIHNMALLSPDDLPTQWRNYSGVDLIFVSTADLVRMKKSHPEQLAAIRRYVRAGGTLCAMGVGTQFERLVDIDDVMDFAPVSPASRSIERAAEVAASPDDDATGDAADDEEVEAEQDEADQDEAEQDQDDDPFANPTAFDGWLVPPAERVPPSWSRLMSRDAVARSYSRRYGRTVESVVEMYDDDEEGMFESLGFRVPPVFRVRHLQMGRVVGIGPSRLSDLQGGQLAWMMGTIGNSNWRWYMRHGMSLRRSNRDFWDFLIPGVGAAPVKSFLGLITCFMIAIGPVNYFLLQRARKLYLLLVTVPLGAAIVTGGLYSFALIKDGLGSRVRMRSFSLLSRDGELSQWARHSYYAGVAPSSGLTFSRDYVVFPYDYQPSRTNQVRRGVRWKSDQQQLTPGYVKPRSTSQLVTIATQDGVAGIQVAPADGTQIQVTNPWQVGIERLLVFDNGKVYATSNLASDTTRSITLIAEGESWVDRDSNRQPATPPGFTKPRLRNNYYWGQCDQGFSNPNLTEGVLERHLMRLHGRCANRSPFPGRHYVAFCHQAPKFVAKGLSRAREEAGYHVVQGEW